MSCKSDSKYEKAIIGEWKSDNKGYTFSPDGICERKGGFFKTIILTDFYDRKTFYLGTATKYDFKGDSLRIYDPSDSTWLVTQITKLNSNELLLKYRDGGFERFKKTTYTIDPEPIFDEIVVSSSGCYGTCPINQVSIKRNGNLSYFGYKYNLQNGYFTSIDNSNQFLRLENDFKKADIKKLEDKYDARWTDDEEVCVTFIKNNKIIKTVRDYGRVSPAEFCWAYASARFLYQQVKLDTLNTIPEYLRDHDYFRLEKGAKASYLSLSEEFYLWNLLLKAKQTLQKANNPEYQLVFYDENAEPIKTDGQYFTFKQKDGREITLDIGFNFITTNSQIIKFRDEPKDGEN